MTNEELQKAIEVAEESVAGFADDGSFEHLLAMAVLELKDRVLKEREACANTAGLALLGADKALSDRVLKAIRARGQE